MCVTAALSVLPSVFKTLLKSFLVSNIEGRVSDSLKLQTRFSTGPEVAFQYKTTSESVSTTRSFGIEEMA